MMKRLRLPAVSLLLVLLLGLCAFASAAPALEDNGKAAWIGPDNNLMLMNAGGEYTVVPMQVKDILSFSDSAVYCRMDYNLVYEITLDGSESRLVQDASAVENAGIPEPQEGRLTLGSATLSGVETAVSDGQHVCVISLAGGIRSLAVCKPDGAPWQDSDGALAVPDGSGIPEPLYAVLAGNTLTVTGTDHSVWIGDLVTGAVRKLDASGSTADAAAYVAGKLYLYTKDGEGQWKTEQAKELLPNQNSVNEATPTRNPRRNPRPPRQPRPL